MAKGEGAGPALGWIMASGTSPPNSLSTHDT